MPFIAMTFQSHSITFVPKISGALAFTPADETIQQVPSPSPEKLLPVSSIHLLALSSLFLGPSLTLFCPHYAVSA